MQSLASAGDGNRRGSLFAAVNSEQQQQQQQRFEERRPILRSDGSGDDNSGSGSDAEEDAAVQHGDDRLDEEADLAKGHSGDDKQQHNIALVTQTDQKKASLRSLCGLQDISEQLHDIHNPQLQQVAACGIGVIHGIAGPGGVLGVLPAVELHDGWLATLYLSAFCGTSIVVMGVFAASFGEATTRLVQREQHASPSAAFSFCSTCCGGGGGAAGLLRTMSLVAAGLSIVVGVLWLVLLYFGILDEVFP